MSKAPPKQGPKANLEVLPVFVSFFISGLALSECFSPEHLLLALALSLILLCAAFFKLFFKYSLLFLGLSALCSGVFYGMAGTCEVKESGSLLELNNASGSLIGRFKRSLRHIDDKRIGFFISEPVFSVGSQTISIPDRVLCVVEADGAIPEPEQLYKLDGFFKFESGGASRFLVFYSGSLTALSSEPIVGKYARRVQDVIKASLNSVLPPRHAGIILGFILGDTSAVAPHDKDLFRETGISHLTAVSGQHVMVLVLFLASLLHWLKIPPISRSLVMVLTLICYALITSGSASVYRALIMYFCLALVVHLEALNAPARSISLAALIILLYNPNSLNNVAFQLSFIAVIGILVLSPPFERLFNKIYLPGALSRYLAASLAANIAIIPIAAHIFGTVSLASIVINPLILWSFSYILPLSFILAALSIFWPAAAILIAPALSLAIEGILRLLEYAVLVPGHYLLVGNISQLSTALCYAFMLALLVVYNHLRARKSTKPAKDKRLINAVLSLEMKPEPPQRFELAKQQSCGSADKKPARVGRCFYNFELLQRVDNLLLSLKRRPLKGRINKNEKSSAEVLLFGIENQTLYYQIEDLTDDCLLNEPDRIIQGLVYLMALLASELTKASEAYLSPDCAKAYSPEPAYKISDRRLSAAVSADSLLFSNILTQAEDNKAISLQAVCQTRLYLARQLLCRVIDSENKQSFLNEYCALKDDMLTSCFDFIKYNREVKKKERGTILNDKA